MTSKNNRYKNLSTALRTNLAKRKTQQRGRAVLESEQPNMSLEKTKMSALEYLILLEKDARDFGFQWPNYDMIFEQIIGECEEVKEDLKAQASPSKLQEEIGDVIHAALGLCIFAGFDVEETLAKTGEKFSKRMMALKEKAKEKGFVTLHGKTMEEMLLLWEEIKKK